MSRASRKMPFGIEPKSVRQYARHVGRARSHSVQLQIIVVVVVISALAVAVVVVDMTYPCFVAMATGDWMPTGVFLMMSWCFRVSFSWLCFIQLLHAIVFMSG